MAIQVNKTHWVIAANTITCSGKDTGQNRATPASDKWYRAITDKMRNAAAHNGACLNKARLRPQFARPAFVEQSEGAIHVARILSVERGGKAEITQSIRRTYHAASRFDARPRCADKCELPHFTPFPEQD
jgi:hypothetical protein